MKQSSTPGTTGGPHAEGARVSAIGAGERLPAAFADNSVAPKEGACLVNFRAPFDRQQRAQFDTLQNNHTQGEMEIALTSGLQDVPVRA